MTNPPASPRRPEQDEVRRLYQAVSGDSRYGHYVRIPERVCRCLDYFGVASHRRAVRERLHSYYLFIGVVDDVIDGGPPGAGREILERLSERTPAFGEETRASRARLVTEVLKCHISPGLYPVALAKLGELYRAVVGERTARTIEEYVGEREAVGRITAELSYLLIRPLLEGERDDLCRFLQRVGEVGCLVDSVLDLRSDARQGLLGFRPTPADHLKLAARTLRAGARLSLEHPRLFGLFLEAVGDDLLDWRRARAERPARSDAGGAPAVYAREGTARNALG